MVERAATGVSTPVYRIQRGEVTCYLRLAEGPEASLAPEALAHTLLRARGVLVPEVVDVDPCHAQLGRSVMVTAEIPGRSLAAQHHGIDVAAVLAAAGRDLAVINGVDVTGFGFIRRDQPNPVRLEAEAPTLRAFAVGELDRHLAALSVLLGAEEIRTIRGVVAQNDAWLDANQAVLAHGDLDATHIYHRDGEYSGIIDFGEIRGADPFYDLGHFALHDGESISSTLLPRLLAGYGEVTSLDPGDEARIWFWSLLIGARALARSSSRPPDGYQAHLTRAIRKALLALHQ